MRKNILNIAAIVIWGAFFYNLAGADTKKASETPKSSVAIDPGKPDEIIMDSVLTAAGQKVELGIRFWVDDTVKQDGKQWYGIGTLCIPIKYDSKAFKIDSVNFMGTMSKWDEKFTNAKIDTGFISINGIHSLGGKEKPTIFTSGKPEQMLKLFISISQNAKTGVYDFQLTADPLQKELYFGSPDGVHSWKPKFVPGKIFVK